MRLERIEEALGHGGGVGFAGLVDVALGYFDDRAGAEGLGGDAELFGAEVAFEEDAADDLAAVGGGDLNVAIVFGDDFGG